MATEGRTQAAPVSDAAAREALDRELVDQAHSFRFFQAVRLLERLHPERTRVGHFGHPADEVVRFGANPDLSFPAGEIQELLRSSEDGAWNMTVNFMGLVGHMGVLPHHYSTLVIERTRNRDRALRDFLDLFHHRLVSLFYRAWERYRFYVSYERGEGDRVTDHLFDLIGLGSVGAREALGLDEDALLAYVGLLGPHQRSAAALQQLLEDYFEVPVEVEQFVGAWYDMSDTAQCRVDDVEVEGTSRLGRGALVGDEVWDPGSRARIVVGPLPLARYRDFLPTGSAYREMRAITRFFSDDQIEFELRLILDKDEVPAVSLGVDGGAPLGWSTWLRSAPFTHDASDTVLSL
jgi:type VI secretion system protein ImpH